MTEMEQDYVGDLLKKIQELQQQLSSGREGAIGFMDWCMKNGFEKYPGIDRWKHTITTEFLDMKWDKKSYDKTSEDVYSLYLQSKSSTKPDSIQSGDGSIKTNQ